MMIFLLLALLSPADASSIGSGYDILVGAGNGCWLHDIRWEKVRTDPPDMGSGAVGAQKMNRTYVSWVDRSFGFWWAELKIDHANDPPGVTNAEIARKAIFYICGVPPLTEAAWVSVLDSFPPRLRMMGLALLNEWWGGMFLPVEARIENADGIWQPFYDIEHPFAESMRQCRRSKNRCEDLAHELYIWSSRWHPPEALLGPSEEVQDRPATDPSALVLADLSRYGIHAETRGSPQWGGRVVLEGFARDTDQGAVVAREWPIASCDVGERWPQAVVDEWVTVSGTMQHATWSGSDVDVDVALTGCVYRVGLPDPLPSSVESRLQRVAGDDERPAVLGEHIQITGTLDHDHDGWTLRTPAERILLVEPNVALDSSMLGLTYSVSGIMRYRPPIWPSYLATIDPSEAAGDGRFYVEGAVLQQASDNSTSGP